jgi:hypothetical protein
MRTKGENGPQRFPLVKTFGATIFIFNPSLESTLMPRGGMHRAQDAQKDRPARRSEVHVVTDK